MGNGGIERIAVWKCTMAEDQCLYAGIACASEAGGIFAIRDDNGDSGVQGAVSHGIDERLKIRPTAGNQDADVRKHAEVSIIGQRSGPLRRR